MAMYYKYTGTNSTWRTPSYQHLAIRDRQLQLSDKELEVHCIQELLKIQNLPNTSNLEKVAIEAIARFRIDGTIQTIEYILLVIVQRNNQ